MGGAKGLGYRRGESGVGANRWCQVPMIWVVSENGLKSRC